jgi:hypothetical protein
MPCSISIPVPSYKKCCPNFRPNSPDAPTPNTTEIYKYVEMFRATGSVVDRTRTRRRHVLTEEKLDEVGC